MLVIMVVHESQIFSEVALGIKSLRTTGLIDSVCFDHNHMVSHIKGWSTVDRFVILQAFCSSLSFDHSYVLLISLHIAIIINIILLMIRQV